MRLDVQVLVESKDDASLLRVCLQYLSEDTSVDFQQVYIDYNSDEQAGTFLTPISNSITGQRRPIG